MVFYLIGLGLGDAKDITVKGLELVRKAARVYLEAYTSILTVGQEQLVFLKFYFFTAMCRNNPFCRRSFMVERSYLQTEH